MNELGIDLAVLFALLMGTASIFSRRGLELVSRRSVVAVAGIVAGATLIPLG